MIRIDEIWLATEPLDMRAGPDTALARVLKVFGTARPHCAYFFANRRGNRMKVLIHDSLGVWLCARRLNTPPDLAQLTPDQLRHLAPTPMTQVELQEQALAQSQKTLRPTEQVNQKLTYELALLKRHAFGKRSEQLNVLQISLLEEVVGVDIVAIETELEDLNLTFMSPTPKKVPKRAALPSELPRTEIRPNPESEYCACGRQLRRIGERSARSSTTHRACSTTSVTSVAPEFDR